MQDYINTEQCHLSIRLSSDGFSFYLADPVKGGSAVYENFALPTGQAPLQAVEEIVYAHQQLLLPYKRTELVVVSPQYSVEPAALYNEDCDTLSFIHTDVQGKSMINRLRKNHLVNRFVVDEDVYGFLARTMSLTRVTHYITPLLEYFIERSRFGNYSKMYVNLDAGRLDIFCFDRNKLMLANSYSFQELNDAIYFVLYAWEKLNLHQANDELHICGDAALRSRIIPYFSKYIQRVLPLNPPTSWYVAPADNKPLPLELKTLSLCV